LNVNFNTELQNNTTFLDFHIQEVIPFNKPVLLNLSAVFYVTCYMIMLSLWRICSIVDILLNGRGAVMEWYWQGESKQLGGNLSQSHFVHCKFNMDWPGIRPVS